MQIDKYTKIILTLIAMGVLGINFYLYKVSIVDMAHAAPGYVGVPVTSVTASNDNIYVISDDGAYACKFSKDNVKRGRWEETGCDL